MTSDDYKAEEEPSGLSESENFVQIFLMDVNIESASNLIKADAFGKSDPYCKVTALGKTYTTRTIMKTLEPTWNEKSQFCFFQDPKELSFEVWDWDKKTSDDKLGDVKLPVSTFFDPAHSGYAGTLTLLNVKKGTLSVAVTGRKLLPLELENRAKALQEETAQQGQQIEEQKNTIQSLNHENENLTNDNLRLTNENTALVSNKKIKQQTKADLDNQMYTLGIDVDRLTPMIEGMEGSLNEEGQERDRVAQELNAVSEQVTNMDGEQRRLTGELNDLRRQLAEKKAANERRREDAQRKREASEKNKLRIEKDAADAKAKKIELEAEDANRNEVSTPLVEKKPTKKGGNTSNSNSNSNSNAGRTNSDQNQANNGCKCCVIL